MSIPLNYKDQRLNILPDFFTRHCHKEVAVRVYELLDMNVLSTREIKEVFLGSSGNADISQSLQPHPLATTRS